MTPATPQPEALPTPVGFCPKCHYPLDPGTCPECGTEVTEGSILTSLSQTRAAKTRRWALRIGILVLLAAAIYGAWRIPWPYYMPTSWLLAMQRDANHWATIELGHRYMAGMLSSSQVEQMIRASWIPLDLKIRDPVPFKSPVKCELTGGLRVPLFVDFNLQIGVSRLRIDGTERDTFSTFCHGSCWHRPVKAEHLIYALPLGVHELVFDLFSNAEDPKRKRNFDIWKGTVRKTVVIIDAPATEFVQRECPPQIEKNPTAGVALGITVDSNNSLALSFLNLHPIAVAGHVEVRTPEHPTFRDVGLVAIKNGDYGFVHIPSLAGTAVLDVRIIPDETVAVEHSTDMRSILSCPLEWDGQSNPIARTTGRSTKDRKL